VPQNWYGLNFTSKCQVLYDEAISTYVNVLNSLETMFVQNRSSKDKKLDVPEAQLAPQKKQMLN
jgi:hypothetical protein